MADLLEEQRDKSSSVAKASAYKAEKGSKDSSKDSSKNKSSKKKKKSKKEKSSNNSSNDDSDLEPEKGKTASFIAGSYNLATGGFPNNSQQGSLVKDSSSESSNSNLDFPELNLASRKKVRFEKGFKDLRKSKKTSKVDPIMKDALLYDTGSTCHIVNNKASFTSLIPFKKGEALPILTGGGVIWPEGLRTAEFQVLVQKKPKLVFRTLTL